MQNIPRYFKSSGYRLHQIWLLHNEHYNIFYKFSVDTNSDYVDITKIRPMCQNTASVQIYYRKATATWVYKLTIPGLSIAVKIYKIKEYTPSTVYHHDLEVRYLVMFRNLVENSICPHILLPIGRLIHKGHLIKSIFPTVPVCKTSKYTMIMTECADSSLTEFVQTKYIHYELKCAMFQVIFTLLAIQHCVPSFRHNDLHMSNVLVQYIDTARITKVLGESVPYVQYTTPDNKHYWINLSNVTMRVLLCDMFYASSQSVDIMKPLSPYMSNDPKNASHAYCDMHKFFDSCEYVLTRIHKFKDSKMRDFFNYIVPEPLKCASRGKKYKLP
jgi:hypothetical protein